MPWGTFTPQHIATLFLSVAVPVLLFTTGVIRFNFRTIPLIVLYLGLVWCIAKPASRRNRGKTEDELATVK